jgi:hypothetical protein
MSIFISACGTVDRAFQCPSTANLACQQRNSAPPNQEFPLLGRQSPKSDKANKTGGLDALSLETVPLYDPYDGLLPSNSFHRLANSTAVYVSLFPPHYPTARMQTSCETAQKIPREIVGCSNSEGRRISNQAPVPVIS